MQQKEVEVRRIADSTRVADSLLVEEQKKDEVVKEKSTNITTSQSDRYYATFKCFNGWGSQENYDIFIDKKGVDDFLITIQAIEKEITSYVHIGNQDDSHSLPRRSGIMITKNQLKGFVSNLTYAKEKYNEWVAVAKANDVLYLDKRIDLKSQPMATYFYFDGKNEIQVNRRLIFNFGIINFPASSNDILYSLTFGDFDNLNMRFLLTFSSSKEISDFINLLSLNKINTFLNKEELLEELFK
jgi:hypothetical protein